MINGASAGDGPTPPEPAAHHLDTSDIPSQESA
jgi:hypothetical protein